MKRKASSDRLMQRMQRLTEAKSSSAGHKRPRTQPPVTSPSETVQRPVRLLLSEMRRASDASLVYRSPLATAIEYAQNTSGALLEQYLTAAAHEPLWSIQREAVAFMKQRERDVDGQECRGGLLCDEMGLGKSKDALCTVLEQNQARARVTRRRFNGATLVVCRHILIKNWLNELQAFPRQAFEYAVLTSTSQQHATEPAYFARCCDLVFTTYSAVAAAFQRHAAGDADDDPLYRALFGREWCRVVADEAHVFVVETTASAESMMALRAPCKWVLTGTPVQNTRQDLVTLLRFVGYERASNDAAQLRDCLPHMMLRRTRASLTGMANIPVFKRVTRHIHSVKLGPAEQALYYLYAKYALLRRGDKQRAAVKTTQMIGMMRQLCLCPSMITNLVLPCGLRLMGEPPNPITLSSRRVQRRSRDRRQRSQTGELTLEAYFAQWPKDQALRVRYSEEEAVRVDLAWQPRYPCRDRGERKQYRFLCRQFERTPHRWAVTEEMATEYAAQPLARTQDMLQHIMRHTLRLDMPSAKQAEMVKYVCETPSDDKIIIFSNYVDFLCGTNHWLQRAGLSTVLVTGQTNNKETNDALLAEFECNARIRVLLATLKMCGEGLNLACANRVLFGDPWWNPAILDQAEKRVQRASQQKDISVVYFIAQHTIEEHMLKHLQNKKILLPALLNDRREEADDDDEEAQQLAQFNEHTQTLLFDYTVDVAPLAK